MKIVADEGVDAPIVSSLKKDGHEVIYIREISPGIGDAEVVKIANQHKAIILTADKDFGELIFKKQTFI